MIDTTMFPGSARVRKCSDEHKHIPPFALELSIPGAGCYVTAYLDRGTLARLGAEIDRVITENPAPAVEAAA